MGARLCHVSTLEHASLEECGIYCCGASGKMGLVGVPDQSDNVLWDLSSLSAIARSIIETHDALAYIAIENITVEERNFRISLWEYHDTNRRLKMLAAIGSQDPKYFEMKIQSELQKQRVIGDPHFINLSSVIGKASRI